MRGLSFTITAPRGTPIKEILNCLGQDFETWFVVESQSEVWDFDMEHDFFDCDIYHGAEFIRQCEKEHFVISLKLQAYSQPCEPEEITTHEQFASGSCQILLLIIDSSDAIMYIRDRSHIEAIRRELLDGGFQNVQCISEHNDMRKRMQIV